MRNKKTDFTTEAMKMTNEALRLFQDAIDANAIGGINISKLALPEQLPTITITISILPTLLDRMERKKYE